MKKISLLDLGFNAVNYILLGCFTLLCVAPMVYLLAISFSSSTAISTGQVFIVPVDFTAIAYEYCLSKADFLRALLISIERVAIGIPVNVLLAVLAAYPLSKDVKVFRLRTAYVWIFVFAMLFSSGLIPSYMVVMKTGLIDKIWSLILPGAVQVYFIVLLLNFFRSLPKELEEAAIIDGAGHISILFRIYMPLSLAVISTIALFSFVNHWNSWFDGIIYMNSTDNYPLQSYLQAMVIKKDIEAMQQTGKNFADLSNRNLRASQIILGTLPILLVYPFIQKYFNKGITLGSVKE